MKAWAAILTLILGIFLQALVICKLWGWFIVPLLNLPFISIAYAIGLTCLFWAFALKVRESEKYELGEYIFSYLIVPFLLLLIGWIASFFI